MFVTYYDVWCTGRRIAVFAASPIPPMRCEPSKLPHVGSDGYKKGKLVLWLEFAERGQDNLFMMDMVQRVPVGGIFKDSDRRYNLYQQTSLQDVQAVARNVTASHDYVLSVTVEQTYFEN
jgi:hypothetical protein